VVLTTLAGMYYGGENPVSETLAAILVGVVNAIALPRVGKGGSRLALDAVQR